MVVVVTQTHPYRGGDGGSRYGDGDGVAVMWRRGGGGCDGSVVAVVVAARLCGSHDDGGVVEMRMCGGSVVGVAWDGVEVVGGAGGWWPESGRKKDDGAEKFSVCG
ncbi:hypothetical protein Tco_1436432 [Tanacetum coccineum]